MEQSRDAEKASDTRMTCLNSMTWGGLVDEFM
jgi:hypothetical protein